VKYSPPLKVGGKGGGGGGEVGLFKIKLKHHFPPGEKLWSKPGRILKRILSTL
jgi:hypothetical protein